MGFVFGTLCLMGLVAMAASGGRGHRGWHHHRRHAYAGHGGGCGGGKWRGRGRWRDREESDEEGEGWRARRPEDFVNVALDGVGLREEQRPHVEAAVKDAGKAVKNFVDHLKDSRDDLLSAVRGDAIDEAKLAAVFEWHDDALSQVRKDVVDALKRVHAALDPDQRSKFADAVGSRGVHFV